MLSFYVLFYAVLTVIMNIYSVKSLSAYRGEA